MFSFWLREAFKSIPRAKFPFILSLISLFIATLLILVSFIILNSSSYFEESLSKNITINTFLDDELSEDKLGEIKNSLLDEEIVSEVEFISKEKAAELFVKETGEDFRKILDYNPLPASYIIHLKKDGLNKSAVDDLIARISKMEGINDVVYRYEFAQRIIHYLTQIKKYIFIITAVIVLISVYLVYSTVRLILNARSREFETMKLVGAKISAIKMPIILNGFFTGLFAAIIALGFVYLSLNIFKDYLEMFHFLADDKYFYLFIILVSGPVLGILVSVLSLKNVSLKI